MSIFNRMLAQFIKIGVNDKAKLNEKQINQAMDTLCNNNAAIPQFDRQVAEQIWDHSAKTSDGKVLLKDYIQTLIDAQNILKENIDKCNKQLSFETNKERKNQLEQCLLSYNEDYRILIEPFNIENISISKNASMSRSGYPVSHNASQIFSTNPSPRQQSRTLKLILIMVVPMLISELFCMYVRHHFMNTLAYLAIISIFLLNYFDKNYMRFTLITTAIAVGCDLLWLISHSDDYWNANGITQYSTLQPGFLKFIFLMTLILFGLKIFLIILLFRFRSNDENTRKVVKIFNTKFLLNGTLFQNPVSLLMSDNKAKPLQN